MVGNDKIHFPIVGIGSSAGGLKALEAFFMHMPDEPGVQMAFALVQHLAPDYKSILGELLERYTNLQVCEVQDGMDVAPHCIYVTPPNRDLIIRRGRLYLKEMTAPRGMRFPIDVFFRSLAEDQKERSICIILSGGGTDSLQGMKAVKGEGGMVMVQDPDTAEHKSMPHSAIATGLVDYVLPPEEMSAQLAGYVRNALQKRPPVKPFTPETEKILPKIFILLHAQTGHDFSGYKQSTTTRRIDRRLLVNRIEDIDSYLRYLQQNPLELEALFRELLVGVTGFFRDPEAFLLLQEKVIPRLFAGKNPEHSVRIWVPGCSTGEEPFSLAILLKEYLEELKQFFKVQIFATDINSRAIEQGRRGLYPASIAGAVSPERLKRFFVREPDGNSFRIQKSIRDMIVFAEHNVTGDPPFSGLDLISCRNLLIFMDRELQKKLLHLFHYALNPESFLLLGTSETAGELEDYYTVLDRKWKLYQSKSAVTFHPDKEFLPLFNQTVSRTLAAGSPKSKTNSIRELVEHALLQQYAPACVVINKRREIIYIHGRTGKYLEPAPGEVSLNIERMAREGLKLELAAAIRKASVQKISVCCRGLQVRGNGITTTAVNLTVSPFAEGLPAFADLLLVVFEDAALTEGDDRLKEAAVAFEEAAAAGETAVDDRTSALEQELHYKEEFLQTVIEELESTNEELQSTSEEFQSTNEELETSKEELQSVNEELTTVNAELQKKIEELSSSNNDTNNMLAGTGVGTIFVDLKLHILRFTPLAAGVINLIHSDLGRPVGHFASNLADYDCLEEDVQSVLDTLVPKEVEVKTKNEVWYLMRILPYRTIDNLIEGAVINFIDITELKSMQQEISRLAVVVRDSNDAVTMQDLEGQILAWNPGAEKLYGWSEAEALGMNIRETVLESKREDALKMVVKLAQSEKLEPYQIERLTRDGEAIKVRMTATALVNDDGKPYAIAITERRVR